MASFQVDSEAVQAVTSSMQGTIGTLQAEVARLQGQLGQLQGVWSGQAATAFHGLAAEWQQTQQRVEQNLEALSRALGEAGRRYAEIEAGNASMFQL